MNPNECRVMARECYEMAGETGDHIMRHELLWLAAKWTEQAELIDKPHRPKPH